MTDHGGAASPRTDLTDALAVLDYIAGSTGGANRRLPNQAEAASAAHRLVRAAQEAPAPEPTMVGYATKREAWDDGYDAGVAQGRHLAAQEAPAPEGLLRERIEEVLRQANIAGNISVAKLRAALGEAAQEAPAPEGLWQAADKAERAATKFITGTFARVDEAMARMALDELRALLDRSRPE